MKIAFLLAVLLAASSAKVIKRIQRADVHQADHHHVDHHHADHHKVDHHPAPSTDYHTTTPVYESSYGLKEGYTYAPASYKYDYSVKDEYNNYGAEESREGDSTKGSYFVDLPDGRRLVVTYYVNGNSGFVADVKYEGEIKPYEAKPYEHKAPAYKKPEPVYHAEPVHHAEPVYHAEPAKVADYHHPAEHKVDYHPEPVHHVADHAVVHHPEPVHHHVEPVHHVDFEPIKVSDYKHPSELKEDHAHHH